MCRRCGEPDRRGSARDRRARKRWLLTAFGNGLECSCTWCGVALSFATVQQDRIVAGGPYRRDNLVPACAGCNIARHGGTIRDGCHYGPVGTDSAADLGLPAVPPRTRTRTRATTYRVPRAL